MQGRPSDLREVAELYGLDAQDQMVLVTHFSGSSPFAVTVVQRHKAMAIGVTYEASSNGEWTAQRAYLERFTQDGRVVATADLYRDELQRQDILWDRSGHRIEEVVERRSEPYDDGSTELRQRMHYGPDGKAELLTANGEVVWRRRRSGKAAGAALVALEDLLVSDHLDAVTQALNEVDLALVLLQHQYGGGWTDQLGTLVSVATEVESLATGRTWQDAWSVEFWEHPEVPVRLSTRTQDALRRLDETETPREGLAREVLVKVGIRLSHALTRPPTEVMVLVVHFDSEALSSELEGTLTRQQRERLGDMGLLPDLSGTA